MGEGLDQSVGSGGVGRACGFLNESVTFYVCSLKDCVTVVCNGSRNTTDVSDSVCVPKLWGVFPLTQSPL